MTRQEFRALVNSKTVILDGATGTNLQEAGMPVGVCPEQWILEHPEVVIDLQKRYVEAGTDILYAPTFSANRLKLQEYGLEENLVEMNRKLVALSKQAAKVCLGDTEHGNTDCSAGESGKTGTRKVYIAGDLTMTGQQLYPIGDLQFEELVDIYKEQAGVLLEAGVDLFVVETMMSLQECRAAVLAIREICDLPIMVSLTYQTDGRTLYGTTPEIATVVLQDLGADAIGINCSTGPEDMLIPVKKMAEYAMIPVFAKPNAGLPRLENGKTVFDTTPEEFASCGRKLVEAGAAFVGGCCGTTPAHIKALAEAVTDVKAPAPLSVKRRVLTSERGMTEILLNGNFMVIGERINPTGKKKLQAELREGSLKLVREMALQQEAEGAQILDINMGMNGIDEKQMMLNTIYEVTTTVDLPLCIDSSHVDIIEAALRIYPGRALINSISMEQEKMEPLLALAKKYGAMFILLPLSDAGLPASMEEKHDIIDKIMEAANAAGLTKEDVLVDGLVATVGANPRAALECYETFAHCKGELHVPTVCGLSNISFGLPERAHINTAFLTMAIANGLTMAIANPSQELLMNAAFASDLLMAKEGSDIRYIERMNAIKDKYEGTELVRVPAGSSAVAGANAGTNVAGNGAGANGVGAENGTENGANGAQASANATQVKSPVYQAVLKGNKGVIIEETKNLLDTGIKPNTIINEQLIPAINEVGELFDKQKYFLPQLIASANTMKMSIEYLEPMLERGEGTDNMPTIVIATVEGDIHDIGKNLVVLMLKNYGYNVIDLGKDVPAEVIVDTAIKENAAVISLSALMTTTMMRMKEVVELAKAKNCPAKIIVGGAAINESFAEEIGADGYGKDAAGAVKVVASLIS